MKYGAAADAAQLLQVGLAGFVKSLTSLMLCIFSVARCRGAKLRPIVGRRSAVVSPVIAMATAAAEVRGTTSEAQITDLANWYTP